MLEAALAGLRRLYSHEHTNVAVVLVNLASDLASVGEIQRAREIGAEAWTISANLLGPQHPATLAAAANLALDLRASGDIDAARALATEALSGLVGVLSAEHPVTLRASQQRGRIDLDIMPTTA